MITESAHRTLSDNIKWRSARMTPKVYGDKQQIDVTASPGGEYLQALQQINNSLEMRRAEAIEHEEGETHTTEITTRAQSERSE